MSRGRRGGLAALSGAALLAAFAVAGACASADAPEVPPSPPGAGGGTSRGVPSSATPTDGGGDPEGPRAGPAAGPLEVLQRVRASPIPAEAGAVASRPTSAPLEQWRVRIGRTTSRSTIHALEGRVIVNSHGSASAVTGDREDRVLVLDPREGAVMRRLVPTGSGARDCDGVAVGDDLIVFGTRQPRLFAFDDAGTRRWSLPVDGDVAAPPVLVDLDLDGVLDVVAVTEAGSVFALSGRGGQPLWRLKIGPVPEGQLGFIAGPAVAEVSGDGVPEVFVAGRDGVMRALDGRTGGALWTMQGSSAMEASPLLLDVEGDGRLEVAFAAYHGAVYLADAATGALRWQIQLEPGRLGPLGWYPAAGCLVMGSAEPGRAGQVSCVDVRTGKRRWAWRHPDDVGEIRGGFVVGDVDGSPGDEVVFGSDQGWLVALGPEGETRLTHDVGAPIECTPTLADLDGDGRLDLLVAANDGYLRAYDTAGFPPATVGYYRGDARNHGRF